MAVVAVWTGCEASALRRALRLSVQDFAETLGVAVRTVAYWEACGREIRPTATMQAALDTLLDRSSEGAKTRLQLLLAEPDGGCASPPGPGLTTYGDDELSALELSRRVEASDVSATTLDGLQRAADRLAMDYAVIPPAGLLIRVRRHLAYVADLLEARKTLDQQRRLIVIGGWLSLLGATIHVDLQQRAQAEARLVTAHHLARHADHREILAWCLETRAWDVLTAGDYPRALDLSQQAQAIAPRGSSVHIQATSQEGRASARLGRPAETHDALTRVQRLTSSLPQPAHPEHHYQYDPAKAVAYTATTLAWVGDVAAERYAREALARLETPQDGAPRPRRVATARLDLSLALLSAGKPDEAGGVALTAITSGRIIPSNRWRAEEIVKAVEATGVHESSALRDAYETYCVQRPRIRLSGLSR